MNKKIKEIDIEAFRAYKDIQKFNFMHNGSGNIADLVAIYAPNGYGKTSFFDAVEWAVTGNIERLNTGKPIKEEVRNEKGYILKNKDSKEEYGTVTIISEENSLFSISIKKKTGNMKSDYREGNVETISSELETIFDEKESFCTTNLLAHDKITSFLQNYTAEDKTRELRVMWDENNWLKVLNDITEIYKELENKKKQLSKEISKEKKELKKYKVENDQSSKIIKLLLKYEKSYDKHFINDESFEIEDMLILFNQFHEDSQKERENYEKICNDIDVLLKDYPVFVENQKKNGVLQKKKEEYNKAIKICNKVQLIQKMQEKIIKEIEECTYLICNIEEYYNYINQIKINTKQLKTIEDEKINCQKQKINIVEKIRELDEKIKYNNTVLEELNTKEEQLKKDHYEYSNNKIKKEKYKKLLDKAKYILEQRNKRIQEWSFNTEQIDMFLAGQLEINVLYSIFTDEIISKYNSLSELKIEQKLLSDNNNILECNKKDLIELFDKIQQLSIDGKDIVVEQKQRKCPLCHMEYQDYNELLNRISVVSEQNIELERIDKQIQKNKERQRKINRQLELLIEEAKNQIFAIRRTYEDKYINERKKVNRLQIKTKMWKENLNTGVYVCKILEEKYKQEKLDVSEYTELKTIEIEIEKERMNIKNNKEKVWDSLNKEKIKEKELEKKIQAYELRKLQINEFNNNINTKEMYIKVQNCLKDKEFYDPKYNSVEMKSIIENYSNQLKDEKSNLGKELSDYNLKGMYSKNEYLLKLNECYEAVDELQVKISSYLQRCKKLVDITDLKQLSIQINKVKEDVCNRLEILEEKIQNETSILIGLNGLKEQKIWMSKKQSMESDKMKLEFLIKRIDKLQESKNYVEDYIVNKTNEYFNSDIINQIYNKIDPHPIMKHIKFITEKDKGGLKTRIYTYDESESNKMSPVVYLSSAQVNILSLCIFLSKVLSEKNTTFNTIFIDDPIQHLDGINLLSFIDVLRTITTDLGRQIVISTHNEQFYKLLKVKMDERYYPSKFIELTSTGRIKV